MMVNLVRSRSNNNASYHREDISHYQNNDDIKSRHYHTDIDYIISVPTRFPA